MAFNKDRLSMRRKFVLALVAFPIFSCGVAAEERLQKQKIAAYHDFFTTMDWIAYDQYGTYGRGDTEQEAIEDCRKEYAMRIKAVGIKEEPKVTNERKHITQPSDWWEAFEEQAKAEGMTLAAWLGEAAKAKLPPKVAKKLTERPPANRPPKAKD